MVILAVCLSLPVEWGVLQGAYLWLSPFIALNRVLAWHGLLVFHGLTVLVVLACLWKRRWFCRRVCPVGWSCERVSRIAVRKSAVRSFHWGKAWVWLAAGFSLAGIPLVLVFDPLVVFRSFFSAWVLPVSVVGLVWGGLFVLILLSNFFFPLYWCTHLCPLGGFQDLLADAKEKPGVLLSRRNALLLVGGFSTGFVLSRQADVPRRMVFLPPSARSDGDFYTSCLRCGNCVDACPASIIKLTRMTDAWLAWQTPQLDFSDGYCWSACVKCGQVCPSGALASFSVGEKKRLVIGRAEVNQADCLLTRNKECDRCRSVCDYEAIQFQQEHLLMRIRIDTDKCVGCNACVLICPQEAIRLLHLK